MLLPDSFRFFPGALARGPAVAWLLAAAVLATSCADVTVPPAPPPVAPAPQPPVEVPAPAQPQTAPRAEIDAGDEAARQLLAFHERIRLLSPPELAQEVTRLNALISVSPTSASPKVVLELALALSQTRSSGDLARAVALLDPLTRSSAPELQPWQPLARLLLARFVEQRRVEEQAERQAAQLRETQRNVQQLNEKLEALKAIERSLTTRPAAAAAGGSAPAAAPSSAAASPARP